MKNAAIILVTLVFLTFFSCKEIGFKNKHIKSNIPVNFTIDSVIEEDFTKLLDSITVKYSSQLLVFPTLKDQKLLHTIYEKDYIKVFSKEGLKKYLEAKKNELYSKLKGSKDRKSVV